MDGTRAPDGTRYEKSRRETGSTAVLRNAATGALLVVKIRLLPGSTKTKEFPLENE